MKGKDHFGETRMAIMCLKCTCIAIIKMEVQLIT